MPATEAIEPTTIGNCLHYGGRICHIADLYTLSLDRVKITLIKMASTPVHMLTILIMYVTLFQIKVNLPFVIL